MQARLNNLPIWAGDIYSRGSWPWGGPDQIVSSDGIGKSEHANAIFVFCFPLVPGTSTVPSQKLSRLERQEYYQAMYVSRLDRAMTIIKHWKSRLASQILAV